MSKNYLISLCVGSLLTILPPLALAKDSHDTINPMSKVLQELKTKGFEIIKKIEYTGGKYVVKALNAEGKEIKIRFNGQSGEIEKPRDAQEGLTALDVALKVENAGYTKIYKIDTAMFGDNYEVKAYNKNGKKIELKVDAQSGAIKED